jgi:hypothetical protein
MCSYWYPPNNATYLIRLTVSLFVWQFKKIDERRKKMLTLIVNIYFRTFTGSIVCIFGCKFCQNILVSEHINWSSWKELHNVSFWYLCNKNVAFLNFLPEGFYKSKVRILRQTILSSEWCSSRFKTSYIWYQVQVFRKNIHRLNMELDLQRLFRLVCATPPPPHLGSYTWALLASQDRRHFFVSPCKGVAT